MPPFRVVLPVLVGVLLLYIGINSMAHDLQYYPGTAVAVVRSSLLPIALGAGLLLTALAISRRSRAGYLLALATAGFMVLGGLALIAIEVGYITRGDAVAQWAPIVLVIAGTWIAIWAAHARSVRRARETFATTWRPIDRRLGIGLGALIAVTTAAHVGLGVVEAAAAEAGVANRAQAEQLVQRTSIVIEASDVTLDSSQPAGSKPAVQSMHLEVSVRSLATYALTSEPTVCLTDLATALDPTFKPDVYCWGGAGRALAVNAGFHGRMVEDGTVTFQLDVDRAEGLCAFGPGRWMAQLRLAPRLATANGSGAIVESFVVSTPFDVQLNGQPAPNDPSAPTTDCIAHSVVPNGGS